jgi:osmoprotectant transport system permease protein
MSVLGRMIAFAILLAVALPSGRVSAEPVRVGSKAFTESVVLGEVAAGVLRAEGLEVEHRRELGGTRVVWEALLSGDIDVYPEYTGTVVQEILAGDGSRVREALAERGVVMSAPLGFNNTYAIGLTRARAAALRVETLSQLAALPEVRLGLSTEFMERKDGWPALRDRYGFRTRAVRGLDHDLAYRGLVAGDLDAMDLYSTDAEIRFYDLVVLTDDLAHFPRYDAVLLRRADLAEREPRSARALARLEGALSAEQMTALNAAVKLDGKTESAAAAAFLSEALAVEVAAGEETLVDRLLRTTGEHLLLVALAVLLSSLLAVPLGVLSAKAPRFGRVVLGTVGVLQTIPSLALLVVLIPLTGLGGRTAVVALVVYGLLPIVRNTHSGLVTIPAAIRESAEALGLTPWAKLRLVELPLAAPSILAGIQTSAVVAVGTATLGALIGAGGYGQPILTGVRLARTSLLLEGAIPAAVLALLVQGAFGVIERVLVPRSLRSSPRE